MTTTDTTTKTYTVPEGYALVQEKAGYDLLKKTATDVVGAAWIVADNAHGATTTADNRHDADKLGTKAGRAGWCEQCKADLDAAPAATATAPGVLKVNVNLTVEVDAAKWSGDTDVQGTEALIAAIKAQFPGLSDDKAAELVGIVATKATDPRAEVRDFVLAQVQGLDRIKEIGATVTLRGAKADAEAPAATPAK
jgi:hypothetical protein